MFQICETGVTFDILDDVGLWSFALSGNNELAVLLWHVSKDTAPISKDKWENVFNGLLPESMVSSNKKVFNPSSSFDL